MSHATDIPQHILNFEFDPTKIAPEQAPAPHPVGKFPARITDTEIKPDKSGTQWLLKVSFETPAGVTFNNYNLGNSNETAVRIAKGQLSALCHATGIFNARFGDHYAGIRGGMCMIEVSPQTGEEAIKKGYTQVTKVFDRNGNEPGKSAPAQTGNNASGFGQQQPAQQQPQQTQQPAQNNGGWQQQPAQQQPENKPNDPWANQGGNAQQGTQNAPWGQK